MRRAVQPLKLSAEKYFPDYKAEKVNLNRAEQNNLTELRRKKAGNSGAMRWLE